MSLLYERIDRVLNNRLQKGTKRELNVELQKFHQTLVDFSSNDYLSLSSNANIKDNIKDLINAGDYVLGSKGSRLLDGNDTQHSLLENQLKNFYNDGQSSALLFNSGFDANYSIFSTLADRNDYIIFDEFIHASVHDGMRASRTNNIKSFKHSDINHFREILNEILVKGENVSVFIAVESVYSMDGDVCPLKELVDIIKPYQNVHLIVDEAHSTGIVGKNGRGLCYYLGIEKEVLVRLHTFGKALCSAGAVVICDQNIKEYLINYARPLIFSTSMPLSNVHMLRIIHNLLASGGFDNSIKKLDSNSAYLRSKLGLKSELYGISTPIIKLLSDKPKLLARELQLKGYLVRPISYPTVPKYQDRVRICLHSNNTLEEIDDLINIINNYCNIYCKL